LQRFPQRVLESRHALGLGPWPGDTRRSAERCSHAGSTAARPAHGTGTRVAALQWRVALPANATGRARNGSAEIRLRVAPAAASSSCPDDVDAPGIGGVMSFVRRPTERD
jgi:hypothetical protein